MSVPPAQLILPRRERLPWYDSLQTSGFKGLTQRLPKLEGWTRGRFMLGIELLRNGSGLLLWRLSMVCEEQSHSMPLEISSSPYLEGTSSTMSEKLLTWSEFTLGISL